MFSRLQHHLRAAKHRLGHQLIGICPRDSIFYGTVCQCLNEHVYISRRTSAGTHHRVHQLFIHHGHAAKRGKQLLNPLFFLCVKQCFVVADSGHALSHQSRCIRHSPDNAAFLPKTFLKVRNGNPRCNGNDDLVFRHCIPDFPDDRIKLLWLYRQHQAGTLLCAGFIVRYVRNSGLCYHLFHMCFIPR